MKYLCFLCLVSLLASCSVFLKDEKEIDQIVEDVIHEEIVAV